MATEESTETTPERRPFAAIIQDQRNGGLHGELSDEMARLVEAVIAHDKKGKLTITLSIESNGDGSVFVGDAYKVDVPQPDRPKSLFFTDARGNLSRRDPRQAELPLREVGQDKQPRELKREAS